MVCPLYRRENRDLETVALSKATQILRGSVISVKASLMSRTESVSHLKLTTVKVQWEERYNYSWS